ncbi:glyoxalase [Shewanella sp. c952]|uniref:VOC family protein n=1 Tax=Shewanella sp. c952 TaxID=2815913 RepID=UPI001BB94ED8|nr:VOC family protein [Shewanella sp. c952]GIU05625.1 glyoxalase [Shewanella sp. c952]
MKPTSVNSGSLSWHELTASSSKEAMAFYSQVFGWKFKTIVVAHAPYHIIINDGIDIGGIAQSPAPAMPSNWTGYITVENVDAIAEKAHELGATILFGPEDIVGIGRFCWLKDPQGAIIAAISYLAL